MSEAALLAIEELELLIVRFHQGSSLVLMLSLKQMRIQEICAPRRFCEDRETIY